MDPIHPILPVPPNIPPVTEAPRVGKVDREPRRGKRDGEDKHGADGRGGDRRPGAGGLADEGDVDTETRPHIDVRA